MASHLKNQWIVITGASSGFGAAAALAFAGLGCRVALGARRVDRLEQVAGECRKLGAPDTFVHALDVSRTDSVRTFANALRARTEQRITVLVNNAGGALGLDTVAEGKDEDWETMMQTNVLGVLRMTRELLPLLHNVPGAAIINIGSIAGRVAYEGGSAYCGAKAAELQISRALRLELCGTGIRVCSVDPGLAETEFSLVRFKGDAARAAKVYEGTEPLRAEDVAEAIVWVASRPPHVCIDELLIKPTDQAAPYKLHRRTTSGG